ncbi:hypothetical protein DFS34DRAFT_648116 [Phlyctochytrium arcticum]|nr:hypothetical protein DFS34DRAFT_648116 [Phlyctochytrium arcticum]
MPSQRATRFANVDEFMSQNSSAQRSTATTPPFLQPENRTPRRSLPHFGAENQANPVTELMLDQSLQQFREDLLFDLKDLFREQVEDFVNDALDSKLRVLLKSMCQYIDNKFETFNQSPNSKPQAAKAGPPREMRQIARDFLTHIPNFSCLTYDKLIHFGMSRSNIPELLASLVEREPTKDYSFLDDVYNKYSQRFPDILEHDKKHFYTAVREIVYNKFFNGKRSQQNTPGPLKDVTNLLRPTPPTATNANTSSRTLPCARVDARRTSCDLSDSDEEPLQPSRKRRHQDQDQDLIQTPLKRPHQDQDLIQTPQKRSTPETRPTNDPSTLDPSAGSPPARSSPVDNDTDAINAIQSLLELQPNSRPHSSQPHHHSRPARPNQDSQPRLTSSTSGDRLDFNILDDPAERVAEAVRESAAIASQAGQMKTLSKRAAESVKISKLADLSLDTAITDAGVRIGRCGIWFDPLLPRLSRI